MRKILIIAIISSFALAGWSKWIWIKCGYDCGIFTATKGPPSIFGWYLGLILILLSATGLIIHYFIQKKRGNPASITVKKDRK